MSVNLSKDEALELVVAMEQAAEAIQVLKAMEKKYSEKGLDTEEQVMKAIPTEYQDRLLKALIAIKIA